MTDGEKRRLLVTYQVPITMGSMMALEAAIKAERERCARISQHATVEPYSIEIHPDIKFSKMNDSAQTAAHATAQGIAMKIREG